MSRVNYLIGYWLVVAYLAAVFVVTGYPPALFAMLFVGHVTARLYHHWDGGPW